MANTHNHPASSRQGQNDLLRQNPALEFSLVLPTYNARENLSAALQRIDRILAGHKFEAILVDDDSPDETWLAAQGLQAQYPWLRVIRRRGQHHLSSAIVCGFRHARGTILGAMETNLQADAAQLPELLHKMKYADFAVASSRLGTVRQRIRVSRFFRRMAGWLARAIARVPLSDPTSGFFAVRREVFAAIDDWALNPGGYTLLVCLYARAMQTFGSDRLRLSEVGCHSRAGQLGVEKFSLRAVVEFLGTLFDLRLHPRHEIARPALLPVRG